MSIEERLARLKNIHKKPERPSSANRRSQNVRGPGSGMAMMKN
jgi:hypothetical protein